MVAQGQLLRLATLTGVEQAEDVQDGEHEGNDGQLDPDDVVGGMGEQAGSLEGPEAIGSDGDRGGDRQGRFRNDSEYWSSTSRCAPRSRPSRECSAVRFPVTMNRAANEVNTRNQLERWT